MKSQETLPISKLALPQGYLNGQVAVVTGAGRGIGLEAARAFAWLGAQVVIAELSQAGQEAESLIRAGGGQALFVQTDVSDPVSVQELEFQVRQAYGPATILVNNAIACPTASLLEMDLETWDRVMAINLRGAFLTTKAFLPVMLSKRSGVIINMVSTDAMPRLSAYIASKQGLAAFTRSVAAEVNDQGVAIIALAPGFVDTPGLRAAAHGLSSHFGLSEEEFMKLPIHPAYSDRAMPAGDAGAATAYLAGALAVEYHGEMVTGYTILERAGFIQPGSAPLEAQGSVLPVSNPSGGGSGEQILNEIGIRLKDLAAALEQTEAEFNQLPVFIRPVARAGFKGKSGQSLQDWKHMLNSLQKQITGQDPQVLPNESVLHASFSRSRDLFQKLSGYYRDVPGEMARFVKDPQVLMEVQQLTDERVALIKALLAEMDRLLSGGSA